MTTTELNIDEAIELVRILVVEDDEGDRQAIRRWCIERDLPFVIEEAVCIRDAQVLAKAKEFDVVLLDNQLTDGSGLSVLPFFVAREVPVVFVTGNGSELIAVNALRDGASDYVIKDSNRVYLNFLESTSRHVIQRHRAMKERERLIGELQRALEHIETLRGIIPICCVCKKIRSDDGFWEHVEVYVRDHSLAEFSHGYCPDCLKDVNLNPKAQSG